MLIGAYCIFQLYWRLPRRFAPRNDSVFDTFRSQIGANRIDKHVIANQSADWCGNPFSCNAQHYVGHRPKTLLL